MNFKKIFNDNRAALTVVIPAVIILLPFGYSVVQYVLARDAHSPQPFIERRDESYENCVKDTEYMRFHHWELLNEIREEFVRDGIRGDIRFDKCRECHPNRERFCNQCHKAVNLKPDCFGCHYYPASPEMASEEEHGNGTWPLPRQTVSESSSTTGG
jgi:hypothetical protein